MYFCTRNDAYVHRNPDKLKELKLKIYFQKKIKKVCGIRKWMLHLHPAKRATIFEKLDRILRRKEKKFFKKNFTKSLPDKKEFVTFAPANRKASKKKDKTRS